MQVSLGRYIQPFTPFIQSAFTKLELKSIETFNGGALLGSALYTSTIDPRTVNRNSSETSFPRAAANQSEHVVVYNHANAPKILFSLNRRATGVQVARAGDTYDLTAKKEIIIAAGVVSRLVNEELECQRPRTNGAEFKTAQLLMVSDIGPPKVLQRLKIPLIFALKGVGQNLWVCRDNSDSTIRL